VIIEIGMSWGVEPSPLLVRAGKFWRYLVPPSSEKVIEETAATCSEIVVKFTLNHRASHSRGPV